MSANKQHLPSITALRALEAVERLGSASSAAQELHLTQSAISRSLQGLEQQLGVALFDRQGKNLVLRAEGADYVTIIRAALRMIEKAGLALSLPQTGGALQLAILPSFGMRWLVPLLPEFTSKHPEVALNIATKIRPFDLDRESFDAAIYYGAGDWEGLGAMRLQSENLNPVCSPDFATRSAIQHPRDLLKLPLLQIETRPNSWAQWFAAIGIDAKPNSGPSFDQYTTILQATLHGMGVALLPDFLAAPEIDAGRLIRAYGGPMKSLGAYYLVWPEKRETPALRKFRKWLAPFCEDLEEDSLPR